ncbi:hypothetical protein BO78DRAFT_151412 [Aspergillus sclerotiicarbonarius CBS 121057]|uniref:Uncharacterized protein n=1 Tax=Aspergillus sclerotiicarbonarius (strain CBS 121057 / IBT 28362) TaxID=1448318 RepID=A0A319E5F0_ASPSB|nr:hypothetical protein BO78DRAFT_151412 [Aspergillus sclerotiicarbonarius CBS 121057]
MKEGREGEDEGREERKEGEDGILGFAGKLHAWLHVTWARLPSDGLIILVSFPLRTLSLSTALALSPAGSGALATMVLRPSYPASSCSRSDKGNRTVVAMFLGANPGGCTMTMRARRMIDPSFRTASPLAPLARPNLRPPFPPNAWPIPWLPIAASLERQITGFP